MMKQLTALKYGILFGITLLLNAPYQALAADVTSYNAYKMVYKNKGGYVACVQVRWKTTAGEVAKLWWNANKGTYDSAGLAKENCVRLNQETTVDLSKVSDLKDVDSKTLDEGNEVWLTIYIAAGDTKSCRKDSTKYFYNASGNAKPKFTTSGTTLNNNHCELVSKE
jgi:hypothetical protein